MRGLPGLIGCLYGFVGLASLAYFMIYLVTLIFCRPSLDVDRQSLLAMILIAFPLLNAIVCLVLAYGFFTFRRWGRKAAIVYNACWLVLVGSGLVHSRPSESWTTGTTLVGIVLVGFLIGVILFCATKRGRELMSI
jgi:hypothetical protein